MGSPEHGVKQGFKDKYFIWKVVPGNTGRGMERGGRGGKKAIKDV